MKKHILWSLLLFPLAGQALSPEAAQIFSRGNRLLTPPPKSLRADRGPASAGHKKYKDLEVSTEPRYKEENSEDDSDEEIEETAVSEPLAKKKKKKKKAHHGDDQTANENEGPRRKVFGVGLVGGGAYGIFGAEFDFRIVDQWTAGFGLGTGMSYDTWGLHSRFFFADGTFSPFTQMGYADWYLRRVSQTGEKLKPEYLANRFFDEKDGSIKAGKRLHLAYGGIGIMYNSPTGIAASLQLQYFIHLAGFEGGLYGALGVYYYF